MPTKEECEELISKCSITQIILNGQKGYIIVSSINYNFMFLPKADNTSDSLNYKDSSMAFYWTSSLDENDSSNAYILKGFWLDNNLSIDENFRGEGLSIRPVID